MIWSFSRGSAQVDIEVRRLGESAVFELVVDYPDGSEEVRHFSRSRASSCDGRSTFSGG